MLLTGYLTYVLGWLAWVLTGRGRVLTGPRRPRCARYGRLGGVSSSPVQTSPATSMISFARGAPSTDIVDVEGLKQAAVAAFDADPPA